MNTRTIAIISIVAVVLSSASLVLMLMLRTPFNHVPLDLGRINYATCTAGNPNGMISAIFENHLTNKITIYNVYVNHTVQTNWTCYVNGVATSPAVVSGNSGAQLNITTSARLNSQG